MSDVFANLVRISMMANWLILAVMLLRFLLKKAPRWITCVLWALVALRLVFPFSIESPVSLIPQTNPIMQGVVDTNLIHPETAPFNPAEMMGETGNPSVGQSLPVLPLIWCAGVFVMLCYFAFSYLKMRRLVREAVPEQGNIWICDEVATPFILGIIRPRIYLPSGVSETNREYVLAHERSHLRCKDHWWKSAAFLFLSVYWFDPFVWAAYALVCRDIEFACDERVISRYGLPEKKAYSQALLECGSHSRLVLTCPVAFGEKAVIQRVRNVLNYKRPRFWITLVSLAVIAATAVGFLTVPVKTEAQNADNVAVIPETVPPETEATLPAGETAAAETIPENDLPEEEWWSDGIRIEDYLGKTSYEGMSFRGHIMIVRDPSQVYLATSSPTLSMDTPGIHADEAMKLEHALAAVNAGPFFDDGTAGRYVGSVPLGLALSGSELVWKDQRIPDYGFAGFNQDNVLIVASSMTEEEAEELGIRDGCSAGPVLMMNGKPNMEAYNGDSGYTRRTAVGQRADGAVIFVCVDGRCPESIGATYADLIDILTEYGAVNACAMESGSSSTMFYRDTDGRYGEKGLIQRINSQDALQTSLRRMPTFWMVKPVE